MSSQPEDNRQFTLAIKCHWCGHTGLSMWAVNEAGRQPINPDDFYERLATRELHLSKIETICSSCNRAQPI